MGRRAVSDGWTEQFFKSGIFSPGSREANDAAPAEAQFLWKALKITRDSRVLDVACGTGRHALRLALRGAAVVGVDSSPVYLREARARGVFGASFVRGDMRRLNSGGGFDAAYNVWTSFGYFSKFSDDILALKSIAGELKPGGLFVIDVVNFDYLRGLPTLRRWDQRADGSYLLQNGEIVEGNDPRVVSEWTLLSPKKSPEKISFTVRGYDRKRLLSALRRAGFTPLAVWGALSLETPNGFNEKRSPRLVVLSRA